MAFTMKVGSTDISGYIAAGGFKWSKNDIDASGSGRSKDGAMRRKRVASKHKLQVTCRPLSGPQLASLVSALSPETVSVEYLNPASATTRTATFYGSSVNAATVMDLGDDVRYDNVTFDLVEV